MNNSKYLHQFMGKCKLNNSKKWFNIIGISYQEINKDPYGLMLDINNKGKTVKFNEINLNSIVWNEDMIKYEDKKQIVRILKNEK